MNTQIIKTAGDFIVKHTQPLQKYAPEILTGIGAVGVVTSAVLACKATLKVEDVLDETKEQVDKVHEAIESEDISEEQYTETDSKKDLALIYAQTGIKFVKLYGPAVVLMGLSLTSIFASTSIMRKRNAAIAAAYAAVDQGFKAYRKNVVDRFGEEVDRELKYGIKAEKISENVVDEETGKKKKVQKTMNVVEHQEYSDYAKIFDEFNPEWKSDPERNLYFLNAQQKWANNRLQARGHLFLNEVYEALGFKDTKAGQCVGWVYDPENKNSDGYVSFGIFEASSPAAHDFVNGYNPSIILDFNVDGVILEAI